MIRYLIRNDGGIYQYSMSKTDKCRMYEKTTTWGPDISKARLFTTKGAATNSMWYSNGSVFSSRSNRYEQPPKGMKVVKVELVIRELVEE